MSDLAITALLMGFLIALAITAPIWGYDSRDGIQSDQAARRVAWLGPRATATSPAPSGSAAGLLVAGALRSMAYRLDADAATDERMNGQVARAC
jgi:hypothetical protein